MKIIQKAADRAATGERSGTFVASDESVDRYGDIVRADGWDTTNFERNPQFLFAHNSDHLPIGKVVETWRDGTQFKIRPEWLPAGIDEFADKTWDLFKGGFLNAVSVGFRPLKSALIRDEENDRITGIEYIEQELLEVSLVPVPANQNALAVSRSFNLTEDEKRLIFLSGKLPAELERDFANRRLSINRLRVRS